MLPVPKKIAIIGAGIGGLTAAMKLAHAGCDVTVYEKQAHVGGRCGRVKLGPFTFDLGPTILLMPHVLEDAFSSVGESLHQRLKLHRCDPHYRVHYRDGSRFVVWTDKEKMRAELEAMEPHSHEQFESFLSAAKRRHDTAMPHFVQQHFASLSSFLAPRNWGPLIKSGALGLLATDVKRHFKDERLLQAFSFQTMYLGLSPWEAPSVFSLLPFTEASEGLWYPMGGLHAVALALESVAKEKGVRFEFSQEIKKLNVEGKTVTGVELKNGGVQHFDAVLCNADYAWATKHLLPADLAASRTAVLDKKRHTSSGVMFYWGVNRRVTELLHHNVFFGNGYKESFTDIFERGQVPKDVSFYVNAPAHTDSSMAPENQDALYVLVPVPHQNGHLKWNEQKDVIRKQVLARLKVEGIDIESHICAERCVTPDDWANDLNLERGSNFGLAQNMWQIGPFRPQVKDSHLNNLFYCGASIQPGTGVPTVMLSARFAVEAILQRAPASMAQRYPVAVNGVSFNTQAVR
jgi:phytoene desaturase